MRTDDIITWTCQYCSQENELWIDLTIEDEQDQTEECDICCRPNRLIITHDKEDKEQITVESRLTDE